MWLTAKCSQVTCVKTACLRVATFRRIEQTKRLLLTGKGGTERLEAVRGWRYNLVELLVKLVQMMVLNIRPELSRRFITLGDLLFFKYRWLS